MKTNEVEQKALTMTERVDGLEVVDGETYKAAGLIWKEIKDFRKKVSETFDPIIKAAHLAHKQAKAKKDEVDKPMEAAQKKIKSLMAEYDYQQEEIRRKEETRLLEIKRKEEEELRLKEAAKAEAAGREDIVEAILDAPINPEPVVVKKSTPKVEGLSYRTIWKFRVINPDLVPRQYLKVDDVKLGGVVRALKGQTEIPGVEIYSERV